MSADGSQTKRSGKPKRRPGGGINARMAARIASVQALYQMDIAGTGVGEVVHEFTTQRFPAADGEDVIAKADPVFFAELVRGVVRRQRDLDQPVDEMLATGWRLVRIDAILRAILRSGSYELLERHDVPGRVVINEYINVAHAFFDEDEPRVVNGILDRLARKYRPSEFPQAAAPVASSDASDPSQTETSADPDAPAVENGADSK